MNRFIIFCVGAAASVISEIFWKGKSRWSVALWGGAGMLLLRRIILRFPTENRALLCISGALLMVTLRFTMGILQNLSVRAGENGSNGLEDAPSFTYELYRFFLIAPAYTIIEYLEDCFRM